MYRKWASHFWICIQNFIFPSRNFFFWVFRAGGSQERGHPPPPSPRCQANDCLRPQMHEQPEGFSLQIALDSHGEAAGTLYLDDGHSFAYEGGQYLHRVFEWKGTVLTVRPLGSLPALSQSLKHRLGLDERYLRPFAAEAPGPQQPFTKVRLPTSRSPCVLLPRPLSGSSIVFEVRACPLGPATPERPRATEVGHTNHRVLSIGCTTSHQQA